MFHLFVKFLNSSHGSFESAFAKDKFCVSEVKIRYSPSPIKTRRALASAMVRLMVTWFVPVSQDRNPLHATTDEWRNRNSIDRIGSNIARRL
jgi:hypothetical protein